MSREDLIRLIREKGDERKVKVFEQAKFQTTDLSRAKAIYTQLEHDKGQLMNEKEHYARKVRLLKEELNASRENAQKAQQNLSRQEADLDAVKAESSDTTQFTASCNKHVEDFTEKMLEEINKLFLSDKPELLIQGIEPFVAILRNKMEADNVDVELFFKKHANLVAKMKRMEMRDMAEQVVESKLAAIQPLIKTWEGTERAEQDISEYTVLLKWAVSFCEGAKIELKLKKQEEAVENARKAQIVAQQNHVTKERQVKEI